MEGELWESSSANLRNEKTWRRLWQVATLNRVQEVLRAQIVSHSPRQYRHTR